MLHAPKEDFVKKLCFQVTVGHLRSFRRHFEVFCCSKLKSDKHNRISVPKNLNKTFTCPKGDLVRELCYISAIDSASQNDILHSLIKGDLVKE